MSCILNCAVLKLHLDETDFISRAKGLGMAKMWFKPTSIYTFELHLMAMLHSLVEQRVNGCLFVDKMQDIAAYLLFNKYYSLKNILSSS